ncbi:hypothetical protein HYX00_03900, partial [Candidatus Woesearchaeota archaeon]|nr:hypothetical protein [Candidatus Woesearchaeota archaeon]
TPYKTELKLKLEVKKQSHDIRITKVLLNPSIVDCNRKAKLTADVVNAGSNAENEIALEFRNANLGINSFDRGISLESSDEASDEEKTHTKTLNIEVPSFLNAGTYQFLINLYWKNFVLFDKKTVDLIVRDCISGATKTKPTQEEKKEQEAVTVIQPKEEMEGIPKEGFITSTQETSIFNSPILLSMFLGGFVILVLAGLIVIIYLRKGKLQ